MSDTHATITKHLKHIIETHPETPRVSDLKIKRI